METNADPFNCPECGAHDYGLYAVSLGCCPHCMKAENARLRKLYHLAARDVIFFSTYDEDTNSWPDCGEFFTPVVNVNDTFAYATADAQRITDDQIDTLIRLERRFGNDGVVAWAAAVRGCEPLEPYRTEKYRLARAAYSASEGQS